VVLFVVTDPVCGLPERRGKENETNEARGYKLQQMNAKTIPPESEIRNIPSSGERQNSTETKTEKQARR